MNTRTTSVVGTQSLGEGEDSGQRETQPPLCPPSCLTQSDASLGVGDGVGNPHHGSCAQALMPNLHRRREKVEW